MPCPPPGDLPYQGSKLCFLVSCISRWVLYDQHHLGSPTYMFMYWQFYTQESKEATFEHKVKVKMKSLTHVLLFATPWAVAYQTPPSIEFSRQEYWSRLPFLSPEDLPDPGIKPRSPALQADALPSEPLLKILSSKWVNLSRSNAKKVKGIFKTNRHQHIFIAY